MEVSFPFFRKDKFDFYEEVDSDEPITMAERKTAQPNFTEMFE